MINGIKKGTIVSTTEDRLTLLNWLKKLSDDKLTDIAFTDNDGNVSLALTFEDGTTKSVAFPYNMSALAKKSEVTSGLALKANIAGQSFTGAVTAPSITEINQGYSFTKPTDTDINIVYAGIVKTGNKLTMVIFGAYTPSSNISAGTSTLLGTFYLNRDVVSKIYWYTSGSLTYVTAEGKTSLTYSVADSVDGQFYFRVGSQGEEIVRIYNKAQLNAGTTYHFRIEQTFLLSDNLAS